MADMFKFELRSAGEFFDASFDGQHPAVKTLVGTVRCKGKLEEFSLFMKRILKVEQRSRCMT